MARVLLVEDEPNIASIIVFKLDREGHQVRWESSASAVLARKQGAALVIRDRSLGIFTDKGFTPVDFKVELAMKLATRLKYTPVLPAQDMEEPELLRFLDQARPA